MLNLETITAEVLRLEKSINRKGGVLKNKFNNKMLQEYVDTLKSEGKDVPAECPFESFDTWKETLTKKEESYSKQLARIEKNTEIIEALNGYLKQNSEA